MTGAPCGGFTTRWLVDGRELAGLGLGLEWVDVRDGALGDADVPKAPGVSSQQPPRRLLTGMGSDV